MFNYRRSGKVTIITAKRKERGHSGITIKMNEHKKMVIPDHKLWKKNQEYQTNQYTVTTGHWMFGFFLQKERIQA